MEGNNPKCIKTEEGEDIISSLPDILVAENILSRLPETRYAIRTCVLSKRWQNVWRNVSSLSFDDFFHNRAMVLPLFPLPDFYEIVKKNLNEFKLKSISKLEVSAAYNRRFEKDVESLIDFAVYKKVGKFKLSLRCWEEEDRFSFQNQFLFFFHSHFTHIELEYCKLTNVGGPILWDKLTILSIGFVEVEKDLIENIMNGCPLLNTLTLKCCYGTSFNITSPSVKYFVIDGLFGKDEEAVVEINGPYLSNLTIMGSLRLSDISLKDVSSLVKVELNYKRIAYGRQILKGEQQRMVGRLILSLGHIKEITVGISCCEALFGLISKGFVPPSNLKCKDIGEIGG